MGYPLGKFSYVITPRTEPPTAPFVRLSLSSWFTSEGSQQPVISEDLATAGEIDARVESLKADLDAAGAAAKAALRKEHRARGMAPL